MIIDYSSDDTGQQLTLAVCWTCLEALQNSSTWVPLPNILICLGGSLGTEVLKRLQGDSLWSQAVVLVSILLHVALEFFSGHFMSVNFTVQLFSLKARTFRI